MYDVVVALVSCTVQYHNYTLRLSSSSVKGRYKSAFKCDNSRLMTHEKYAELWQNCFGWEVVAHCKVYEHSA